MKAKPNAPRKTPTVSFKDVESLVPYAKNARTHSPAQIEALCVSLEAFGWTNPVLADAKGIVAGHGRVLAAQRLYDSGKTIALPSGELLPAGTVPVLDCTGWDDRKRRAYIIADNELAIRAGWDETLLGEELRSLKLEGVDLTLTGFDAGELDGLLIPKTTGKTDPDDVPDPPKVPVSRTGDLWLLGRHRLLCGDSTKAEDVGRVTGDRVADMMWADPPFKRDYQSRGEKGACERSDEWVAILRSVSGHCGRHPVWYVKLPWQDTPEAIPLLAPAHFIVWAKRGFGLGGKDFRPQHEILLYGRPNAEAECSAGADVGDVWEQAVPFRGRMLHVAETPVALIQRAIGYSTTPSGIVFDPFGGSCTSAIAAETSGRSARIIEIDSRHVDVAVLRWEAFTGQKATLDGTGQTFEEVRAERLTKKAKR